MGDTCLGCTCSSARTTPSSGRLVLATQVDHTVTALRTLALRKGASLRTLAPGLLALDTPELEAFLQDAGRELSSVEAEEVRCIVVDRPEVPDVALLAQAMAAPSLRTAGARVEHAHLLPLFEDEEASFHAVYQPIVALDGLRRVGHEALLRATAPDGGSVLPDALFPAAEAAGWTHLLDRVGRTTALRDAGAWLGEDLLFINFVPTSIYRPEVCLRTTEIAARRAGVRLDQLVFEVTEGHQVRDLDHLERVFTYYRSRGCKVALDDLGAGYSSLNLLVRLQPDIVKLDKVLVQSLPDPASCAVVEAIVGITHSYGGLVLAECVETQQQADTARALGADLGQGWLFGHPVRPSAARAPGHAAGAERVDPARPDRAVALPPVAEPPAHALPRLGLPELLSRAVAASASGVVVADVLAPDAPLLYVNAAFERLTGYTAEEVVGTNCRFLQGPATDVAALRALSQALRRGEEHRTVLANVRKDGSAWWNELHLSPVHDQFGRLTHYLGFQHDVTARVEAEQQLLRQAAQDSLTGLANRSSLVEQLDAALRDSRSDGTAVAVLFVDLDGFKAVNDRLGHLVGDEVLVQVAQRLRGALRSGDLLARHGGDEFVGVLAGLDPLDAARVAQRVAETVTSSLDRPVTAGSAQARVSASVGIALSPHHGASGEALLAAADAAMYAAKQDGPGLVRSPDALAGPT